jgi:hypothetical protein
MFACRVLGHRHRFIADGPTMRWTCDRGCGAGGEKRYDSTAAARRYAVALDRDGRHGLGRRAPLFGLLPLRVGRALLDRHARRGGS